MFPKIASLGPLTIHSYGLLIALGVLVSIFLATRRAQREGFPPAGKVVDLLLATVFSGFLGARLFYVIQEWPWYREHPFEIFQIWKGGLVYYGGLLASFLGFYLYAPKLKLSFLAAADFLIPYVALAHAFGRIGCFLNGCCFGKPCSLLWVVALYYPAKAVHPVQLYETILNFGIFGFLLGVAKRRKFVGEVTLLYLLLYPAGRFLLEFWRGDQNPWVWGLTFHQVLSAGFFFVGIFLYGICRRTPRERPSA